MDAHEITDIDKLLDALELQQDNDEKSLINQENIVPKRLASGIVFDRRRCIND